MLRAREQIPGASLVDLVGGKLGHRIIRLFVVSTVVQAVRSGQFCLVRTFLVF